MKKKGFTLLEVLLVIGIIAILAGIVIVAINPGRQLAVTRNTERRHDIKQIKSSAEQYYIDRSTYPDTIPLSLTEICDTGSGQAGSHGINCETYSLVDLSSLVPIYLVAIPKDPAGSDTTNGTGYKIMRDPVGDRIIIVASQPELSQVIAIGTSTVSGARILT